jgi:soluble lytic murein transglycosylase-like protein
LIQARDAARQSVAVFLRDVGHGLLAVSHNTLALLGLVVVAVSAFAAGHPELRVQVEQRAFGWLKARQEAARVDDVPNILATLAEREAVVRATAADPKELSAPQAKVAQWISRRYRVAPEPISRLVKEAWDVGERAGLDPTLILAIMAIESSFNPFAQSSVGAQGLMQVMTHIHDDKYVAFGGNHAAFDPVTNVRVGVQVLKECISRAGGLEAGLRYYVGAANLVDDGGYAAKVLAEQQRLKLVSNGKPVPIAVPPNSTAASATSASSQANANAGSSPSAAASRDTDIQRAASEEAPPARPAVASAASPEAASELSALPAAMGGDGAASADKRLALR